ncbi:RAC-alpha serine/threonine-protein kinase [Lindgomyces ingoldianus]|uniref:RAC-alpha serine/threonine-protein kinase n=1 Tax=Lindgomyces ingoldianus TaxID=673940 RepID=A0ACB6QQZ0_9PLEO|nr:RAC-alpha serine/threonine-protein kinase [Lindgomyces ingoldianus]KAF2468502.1 RAC-alpha serine/threonine-protein kinase [Lindgomyces ingoldianus]
MGQNNGKPVVFTDQVNLNHFRLLRVVGKGAFGKVRIVERKDTGLTFALKYIRKDEVVRSESVRNIIRERRMLEHLNHPFLCNLRYSFQDIEYLYIVVDLMNGGDLRFHISRKTFTEDAVQFWIAELGCAVRYIHQQGIVHRDIKPDNVLLDSDGHVHLADFNVASDFIPHKPLTSKSGTLAYLAPEVYEGKGYSCEVDWWSLGVLFYECIYNKRPFEASNHDSLSQKISKGEPTFPVTNPPVSMPCLHAISSLLEKDRKKRIGAIGFETFADNPFFRPIDFGALEAKEIEPIFKPSSDKTNFDATYDLEELLLEEAPLEARARRQKPREALKDDATEQEIRAEELHKMIETLFEPFNYTTVAEQRPAAIAVSDDSTVTHMSNNSANTPTSSHSPQEWGARPLSNSKNSQDDQLRPTRSITNPRSTTHSANGSPPLAAAALNQSSGSPSSQRGERADYFPANGPETGPPSFSRPMNNRQRGSTRSTSMGGGVQVVLNETGSWSDMANQSSMLVQNQNAEKPTGMLGFLSRKKGRDRSPKAKERGVLGKEGARVIISNT